MENVQENERKSGSVIRGKSIAIGIAIILLIIGVTLLCLYFLQEGQVPEGTLV